MAVSGLPIHGNSTPRQTPECCHPCPLVRPAAETPLNRSLSALDLLISTPWHGMRLVGVWSVPLAGRRGVVDFVQAPCNEIVNGDGAATDGLRRCVLVKPSISFFTYWIILIGRGEPVTLSDHAAGEMESWVQSAMLLVTLNRSPLCVVTEVKEQGRGEHAIGTLSSHGCAIGT
jgi:hypothetical protein